MKRALLDTQLHLWEAHGSKRLSEKARKLLDDRSIEIYFSVVSIWEVAIKQSLGRSDFSVDVQALRRGLLQRGFLELKITGVHAMGVAALPPLHRDPFDRLLLAQAIAEDMTLYTADALLLQYPGPVKKLR